jgi:membrane-associated phospholipid phosphatase
MAVWSYAFDPNVWRLGALILVVWLVRRGAARLAWWVVLTITLGGMLGAVLKLLVGRGRPDLLDPVAQATGYSFPSGHALNSALGAGVFLLVLLPFTSGRPGRRIALWTVVVVVPLVTGVCRVGLGVHWTSDVVAGWLLGVAVVVTTAAGFEAWRRHSGRRPVDVAGEGVEPEIAVRT